MDPGARYTISMTATRVRDTGGKEADITVNWHKLDYGQAQALQNLMLEMLDKTGELGIAAAESLGLWPPVGSTGSGKK